MTPWNRYSHVTTCPDCEGAGYVPSHVRASVDNPYPEKPCECGMGPHEPECEVCGCHIEVAGYDCVACELVANLAPNQLTDAVIADITAAIVNAAAVARLHNAKVAA